jgi:hypothetical protein
MLGQFFLLANLDSMWTDAACVLVACGVESSLAMETTKRLVYI